MLGRDQRRRDPVELRQVISSVSCYYLLVAARALERIQERCHGPRAVRFSRPLSAPWSHALQTYPVLAYTVHSAKSQSAPLCPSQLLGATQLHSVLYYSGHFVKVRMYSYVLLQDGLKALAAFLQLFSALVLTVKRQFCASPHRHWTFSIFLVTPRSSRPLDFELDFSICYCMFLYLLQSCLVSCYTVLLFGFVSYFVVLFQCFLSAPVVVCLPCLTSL